MAQPELRAVYQEWFAQLLCCIEGLHLMKNRAKGLKKIAAKGMLLDLQMPD
jgi:hypothetical protein